MKGNKIVDCCKCENYVLIEFCMNGRVQLFEKHSYTVYCHAINTEQ